MIYADGDNGWLDVVKGFERTAYRLEQQPAYLADVRSGALDDWLAGATEPPGPNDWSRFVEECTAAGATIARVRVFEEPETPYQQWLRWYSAKNIRAGEQQNVMPRSIADVVGVSRIPDRDWWLLDSSTLVVFTFDGGNQTVEVTTDRERVERAALVWDLIGPLAELMGVEPANA